MIATQLFASLSSPIRLEIYRLLVRQGQVGLVSGEIAAALELPPTNTSFHLKAMAQAGLLSVVQEGRYQRYRARIPVMLDLVAYLAAECCAGNPDACEVPVRSADTLEDATQVAPVGTAR